ncbi:hypothetical protein Golomagni_00677 [Golovinomyces magnicellulatus]|nr:hypothetical protein Golomagni_00677 [Golovinomyces magnicellulatus]
MTNVSTLFLVIMTLLFPPVGVYLVAGCGADFLINICLTALGFIPGHIHAFYVEFAFFNRREAVRQGQCTSDRVPGVFSRNVQHGGESYAPIV